MPCVRALVAVTFLLLACASCSQGDDPTTVSPTAEPSMRSPSPTPSIPPKLAQYSPEERAAFAAALAALDRFTVTNDRFLDQGKLTKQQAAYYRRNAISWVDNWANLAEFVNNKITLRGASRQVWLRPGSLDLAAKEGQVVEVRRCVDQTKVRVFADGKEVPQPQLKVPRVYRVKLLRQANETWWRVGLPRQGAPC